MLLASSRRQAGWLEFLTLAGLLFMLCARTPAAELPTTLEGQVEYLEGALNEAIRTSDWRMLELSSQGLKNAGLKGPALELAAQRIERRTALDSCSLRGMNLGSTGLSASGEQIETWGLAVRARCGDEKGLTTLKTLAQEKIPAVQSPPFSMAKTDAAGYVAGQKAFRNYQRAFSMQENAILCLALMKDPQALELAMAALRNRPLAPDGNPAVLAVGAYSSFGPGSLLPKAALAADPVAGLKELLSYIAAEDPKLVPEAQLQVFSYLVSVAPGGTAQPGGWAFGGASDAGATFQYGGDIAASLPADTLTQLVGPFAALSTRLKDPNSLNSLTYQLQKFAALKGNADLTTALEALKAKVTGPNSQYPKQSIDGLLAKLKGQTPAPAQPQTRPGQAKTDDKPKPAAEAKKDGQAVQPPAPPKEENF